MSQNGKGSRSRPVKGDVYRSNWEGIFRKPETPKQGIYCIGAEDEMVTFHENGVYGDTFYAKCPEQARDFFKLADGRIFQTREEACKFWDEFAANWKTK